MNGPVPAFQAWMDKRKAEAQPDPAPFPTFKMGGGFPAVITPFVPTVDDDGAKARLKREGNIVELYTQWFNPSHVGKDTGVSCLVNCCNSSAHSSGDNNPSMDLASQNNTGVCRGCGWQLDIVDLAAVAAQIVSPGMKCPPEATGRAVMFGCQASFPDMQTGWTSDGQYRPAPPAPIVDPDYEPEELDPEELELQRIADGMFHFDWHDYFPAGTPGYNWMSLLGGDATKPPDEFHFFNFLVMAGLICGKDVALEDEPNAYANLYTCVVGPPGMGKSLADGYTEKIMRQEYRFDKTDNTTKGIHIIGGAGSGEALAKALHYELPGITPLNPPPNFRPPPPIKVGGVTAMGKYGELSYMAAKSANSSSTLEPMMQALFDTASGHAGGQSLSGGEYYADDFFFSASTTTQIKRMRSLFGGEKVDSGFVSRWVFILGTRKQVRARYRPVNMSGMNSDIRRMAGWADDVKSNHQGLITIPGAFGAVPEFDGFIEKHCMPLELNDLTARAALLYKKLVLLLAINKKEVVVSDETLLAAQKLWKYCIDCLHFIEGKISVSDTSELEARVEHVIEDMQDTTSKNEQIGPSFKALKRRLKNVDEYKLLQVLKTKEAAGIIRKVRDPRVGQRGIPSGQEVFIIPR